MATIIFEQVSVAHSLDASGNKLEVYRYWENSYGKLGRFRATEIIGYGKNISYQSYNFLADGKNAEKLSKMKLKAGSKLFIVGELVPEVFEGKTGDAINRLIVKIHDVRFSSGNLKKTETNEKEEEKKAEKLVSTEPVRIPIPAQKTTSMVHIPIPVIEPKKDNAKAVNETLSENKNSLQEQDEIQDEILNLDIEDLFSETSKFMGFS